MKKSSKSITLGKSYLMILFCLAIFISLHSCGNDMKTKPIESCDHNGLLGKYLFYSETDTSSKNIEINFLEDGRFDTKGIDGSGFWFPAAPLSGEINDCIITLDSYEDIERQGLPSPGGSERNYFESMSGHGEYFPESDSIKLFLTYERKVNFREYFSGDIFLIKI